MKTAISIPDTIFASADKLARRLGTSRSQLYTQAISSYLEKHRDDQLTQKFNEIYSTEESCLDPVLSELQTLSLPKEKW